LMKILKSIIKFQYMITVLGYPGIVGEESEIKIMIIWRKKKYLCIKKNV
jgi:hypothetical protein